MSKKVRSVCKKLLCVLLFCSFVFSFFVGCSSEYYLKKRAKKQNSYTIDLALDESNMTISGYEKFEYENRGDSGEDCLVFHLYPRAFRKGASIKPYSTLSEGRCFPNGESFGNILINEVKVDGMTANFKYVGQDEDKLEVKFDEVVFHGDKAVVEIWFDLVVPNCTHRFGYYGTNINLGNFYPILAEKQNGEYDMTPYYANGDPFWSSCAKYNVSITAPEQYQVLGSGKSTTTQSDNNKVKTTFQAYSVRDFALVIGTNFDVLSQKIGDCQVNYVGYRGDDDLHENLGLSVSACKFFSEKFKEYPYGVLNIVKTPFVHGGMEYPGLVMISDTLATEEETKKVIVHEIAHEWWYGLVGVNETLDAWIDEGLAEFSSALFFGGQPGHGISYEQMVGDALSSYTLYCDVISAIDKKMNTKMNLPVNEYINEYEYTYMIYIKGLLLFDDLMTVTGEKKLVKALSKIANKYAFLNITTDIFTESIKKYTKKNTDKFFESYLDGKAIIGKVN